MRIPVFVRRTREFTKSTCGECEYEECDGSLRWQCLKCALTDAFTGYVLLLDAKPKLYKQPEISRRTVLTLRASKL